MADRILIRHADGRTFSVPPDAHARLYPDFEVVGPETPEAFVATGIPKPKRPRSRPRAKDATPLREDDPAVDMVPTVIERGAG